MRRWLPFLLPFVGVLAGGLGAYAYTFRETLFSRPCSEGVAVAWQDLDLAKHRCVTVRGTAHYTALIKQHQPGNLLRDPKDLYLYGFFAPLDHADRAIKVLVRTDRKPDDLVQFETMTLTGELKLVAPEHGVPFDIEVILGRDTDYFFVDGALLLEPQRFEVNE